MTKKMIISLCLLAGISVCGAAYMGSCGSISMKNQGTDISSKVPDSSKQSAEAIESNRNDRQVLERLYHTMYQYMLAKDIDRLSDMLTAEFVLVHMTGLNQPKEEYLRCIRDGQLNYFTEETERVYIDLYGDNAVITGQSRVNAAVFGGGKHTWPLQLVIELKKQDGKWMMTGAKASTY